MPETARIHTELAPGQVAELLSDAFRELVGVYPGTRILALLMALSDLETAGWTKMSNWNMGNVIAISTAQPFYRASDSGNPRRFVAYDSAAHGAMGLVRQLMRDSRKGWREGLLTGEPQQFVDALAGDADGVRYFESPREEYLATLLERHEKYAAPELEAVGAIVDDGSTFPLYPAEVQTWVIALPVAGGNGAVAPINDTAVDQQLALAWEQAQQLIPGPTSLPRRIPNSTFDEDGKAMSVLEFTRWLPPDDDWLRVAIQFDYLGTDRRMQWFEHPFRVLQVWRIEEHVPESRVHAWLKTLWESAKLTAEDVNEAAGELAKDVGEAAKKAANTFGLVLGLAAVGGLVFWLASRNKRKRD